MRIKDSHMLVIFAIFLIIISVFTTKISFQDSPEYISVAKNFAGIKNINVFIGHSVLYPFVISLFLRIWQSQIMINLVNSLSIFLVGAILLLGVKNRTAFIIYAFSPLTWQVSVNTTPVLPSALMFFISFIFYNKKEIKHHLIYSGIFFGLSFAFYTPMLLIFLIFSLVYFWNSALYSLIKYFIAFFIGVLPRFILEYIVFKNPLYSFIRYAGSNFIITLGLNPIAGNLQFINQLYVFWIVIIISPLLFMAYKLDFKKYKKIIIFLILASFILFTRAALTLYFFIISPMIILLLAKVFTKREVKWHCILSIPLIILLTFSYYTTNSDFLIKEDLKKINQDFKTDYILGGPFESLAFAAVWWENKPYFIWHEDFYASLNNETVYRGYSFDITSQKMKLKDVLEINALFKRYENITYENYILVTQKTPEEFEELNNFQLKKCYKILCAYEPAHLQNIELN